MIRWLRIHLPFEWEFFFAGYDVWIGFYWDRKVRVLYFCPLPMIGVKLWMKSVGY
jgi:hypothetical protein